MILSNGVHQMTGRDTTTDFPCEAAVGHKIINKEWKNKVRYKKGTIPVTDAKAVRVTIATDTQSESARPQAGDHTFHRFGNRLRSSVAEIGITPGMKDRP